MKIICAPDSFKGSLSARQAAQAMARGVRSAAADAAVELCPISDGGEGFTEAIALANPHAPVTTACLDPLGRTLHAQWCLLGNDLPKQTAVIEMACASGLVLLHDAERDPTRTTTFGTGQLMADALERGATHILLGIGGSATTDAGCGLAQALGARFFDQHDQLIAQPISGGMLLEIARIDLSEWSEKLEGCSVTVACDVTNPLTGPNGAAHIYSPQKGATPEQVEQLDLGLRHIAQLWRDQLGIDVEDFPGAGAAGGLGGGLMVFCDAELRSGLDIVLEYVRFDQRVRGCDLCLTGEGQLDGQSLAGKAVLGVAKAAKKHNVPTVALVGKLGPGHEKSIAAGLEDAIEIAPGESVEKSMTLAHVYLERATKQVIQSAK